MFNGIFRFGPRTSEKPDKQSDTTSKEEEEKEEKKEEEEKEEEKEEEEKEEENEEEEKEEENEKDDNDTPASNQKMSEDPTYPPTEFTDEEWNKLRNDLWHLGEK